MARARLLKIGFFENEHLAQLPDKARLLFAGLLLLADRAGRLEDRPRRIRAQVFPYETVDVETHLGELADAGFIVRYVVSDTAYIWIPKFLVHQHPHQREAPSTIPAFSQDLGSARAEHGPSTGSALTEHKASPAVPVSDPDPVPETVAVIGPGEERAPDVAPSVPAQRDTQRSTNPHTKATNLVNGGDLRRHGQHAWCSLPRRDGLCVPTGLHSEFLGLTGRTDAQLKAFYRERLDALGATPVGDGLRHWRREVDAWVTQGTQGTDLSAAVRQTREQLERRRTTPSVATA